MAVFTGVDMHLSFKQIAVRFLDSLTVGTCCRGGFRRAFLSEGHGTAMRESAVGVPPNPALQYVLCYALVFIFFIICFPCLFIENVEAIEL